MSSAQGLFLLAQAPSYTWHSKRLIRVSLFSFVIGYIFRALLGVEV
jgi:hypothetical protein